MFQLNSIKTQIHFDRVKENIFYIFIYFAFFSRVLNNNFSLFQFCTIWARWNMMDVQTGSQHIEDRTRQTVPLVHNDLERFSRKSAYLLFPLFRCCFTRKLDATDDLASGRRFSQ